MSESERQEKEELVSILKLILQTHNELADQGIHLYGMTAEESVDYRLDIMTQIADLQKELKSEDH